MNKYKVTYFMQTLVGSGKGESILTAPKEISGLGHLQIYFKNLIMERNNSILDVSMIHWTRL